MKKLYFVEYYKRANNYANKIVEAETVEQAIKKAKVKNIEDIKELNAKNFTDVETLIKRYSEIGN